MSKRILSDSASGLASFPPPIYIPPLPDELWRKIVSQLFSLSLLDDMESVLNFLATSRAAASFLRPALTVLLLRICEGFEDVISTRYFGPDYCSRSMEEAKELFRVVDESSVMIHSSAQDFMDDVMLSCG
jgi:hypothetical protein